jgi:Na+/H+ antiporter NhaC
LTLRAGGTVTTASPPLIPGWVSLLPPILAIVLALVFREVVVSLFAGVWLGCVFLTGWNPFGALLMTVDEFIAPAIANADHAAIIVFSLLLGGMVGVMARMGGTKAIVDTVAPLATSARRGQLATWLAGLAIFFDDYANTLLVGNTMRPLTDRLKISREKLAYIVDSTAAPVAAIVFVSTWVGYEISLIGDGFRLAAEQQVGNADLAAQLSEASPFAVFLASIPYLFYPIIAIFAVAAVAVTRRDFGPMRAAEQRAASGGGLYREGAQLAADMESELGAVPDGTPLRWWNGALPVAVVVVTVLVGLWATGIEGVADSTAMPLGVLVREVLNNADPFGTLLWGSLLGCTTAIVLATSERILSLTEAVKAMAGGMRSMLLAMIILTLAWSLGAVTTEISTALYLSDILEGDLSLNMLPVVVFIVAALMAFATGTSWGVMAILIPLLVPLAVSLGGNLDGGAATGALLGSIASVLAGAIFGDHCSPISDTTVLSSMASGCDHVDHVRTQLPYALLVAVIAIVVMLVLNLALGSRAWGAVALLVVGCAAVLAFLLVVGKTPEDVTS